MLLLSTRLVAPVACWLNASSADLFHGRRGNTESLRGRVVDAYSASLCRRCATLDDLREVAANHGLGSATQFGGLHGSVVGCSW